MTNKKGFLDIFKSWGSMSEEEKLQRDHALKQSGQDTAIAQDERPEVSGNTIDDQPKVTDEIEDFCTEKLEEILHIAGFSGKVKTKKRDANLLTLEIFDMGEDSGRIIGKMGANLQSLQTLVRQFVVQKFSTHIRLHIDAADYQNRHHRKLKSMVLKEAQNVISSNQATELEPMNPADRKAVHMLFENNADIETFSTGSGHNRRVVIKKKDSGLSE